MEEKAAHGPVWFASATRFASDERTVVLIRVAARSVESEHEEANEVVRDRNVLVVSRGDVILPPRTQQRARIWTPPRELRAVVVATVEVSAELTVGGPHTAPSKRLAAPLGLGSYELVVFFNPQHRLGLDGKGAHRTNATLLVPSGVTTAFDWRPCGKGADDMMFVVPHGETLAFDPTRDTVTIDGLSKLVFLSPTNSGQAVGIRNPSGGALTAYFGSNEQGATALFVQHA